VNVSSLVGDEVSRQVDEKTLRGLGAVSDHVDAGLYVSARDVMMVAFLPATLVCQAILRMESRKLLEVFDKDSNGLQYVRLTENGRVAWALMKECDRVDG